MPTDVISSIAKTGSPDYSTPQAWEDAKPANLVTADQRWIGEVQDTGTYTSSFAKILTVAGSTTDSTRYAILRCAAGASFRDKVGFRSTAFYYSAANGVTFEGTGPGYGGVVDINESYFRLEGIQVRNTLTTSQSSTIACLPSITNIRIEDCIVVGACAESPGGTAVIKIGGQVINTLVIQLSTAGAGVRWTGFGVYETYGCTVVAPNGSSSFGDATVSQNCAIFGFASAGISAGSDYNASDLTLGVGSNNQNALTQSAQFTTPGTDYHPLSSGALKNNGVANATYTPDDIAGATRSATPTIGAVEVLTPDYTLSGPSGGNINAASTNFSVDLGAHTETVTLVSDKAGTWTPANVTGPGVKTLTFTPSAGGVHTITPSDSGSLLDPPVLTYTVIPLAVNRLLLKGNLGRFDATVAGSTPADGAATKRWEDQSGEAMHFTEGTNAPTRHDAGVNSQPSLLFTAASTQHLNRTHAAAAALNTLQAGSFSIVAVVDFALSGAVQTVLSKISDGDAASPAMRFGIDTNGVVCRGDVDDFPTTIPTDIPATTLQGRAGGEPLVLCYTFARTSASTGTESFYINGNLASQRTGGVPVVNATADWIIGATFLSSAYGNALNSDLAYLALYDTALSIGTELVDAQEAARVYAGTPAFQVYESGVRIVGVGDSIMYGQESTGGLNATNQLRTLLGRDLMIQNSGISGDRLPNAMNRSKYDAQSTLNILLIHYGSNNITLDGDSAAAVYASLKLFVANARAQGFDYIGYWTPPHRGDADAGDITRMNDYNDLCLAGIGVDLDVDAVWSLWDHADLQNTADTTYYAADTIHFNNAGYLLMASMAQSDVQGWLPALPSSGGTAAMLSIGLRIGI